MSAKVDNNYNMSNGQNKHIDEIFVLAKEYHEKYCSTRKKYHLDSDLGFNFFTSISEKYHYEEFHSDILKMFLDPRQERIGNKGYLSSFLTLIGLEKEFGTLRYVSCFREKGKIDILIHNKENAIIIENKINGAGDQPDQLARYVEYTENEKLKVVGIVYLTLTLGQKPSFNYSKKYKHYGSRVEKKTTYISAVDSKKKDLVHAWLPKCIEITDEKNIDVKVYLRHYRNLLMHLGGEVKMEKLSKELISEIYSDKEKLDSMNDLQNAWGKREELLQKIVFEEIKKRRSYKEHSYDSNYTIHKIVNNEFSIAYYQDGSFGFIVAEGKKTFSSESRRTLKNIMAEKYLAERSGEILVDDRKWIYRGLNFQELLDKTFDEIVKTVRGKLAFLEKECKARGLYTDSGK